jgi:dimethylhistidine N-methyltransferase
MRIARVTTWLRSREEIVDVEFAAVVIDGLSANRKSLPCRYFYDSVGSELFEAITESPEYYLSRAESLILSKRAADIGRMILENAVLIEFGSGSSRKTQIVLEAAPQIAAYLAIDVSASALFAACKCLALRFPSLDIRPIVGDFARPVRVPSDLTGCPRVGFFPGSTIGNLNPGEAVELLQTIRSALSPGSLLIVGIDLKKDPGIMERAYDDAAGITAAFNLNLLFRINRELGGSFDVGAFRHRAIYNAAKSRVEMHLVSLEDQIVEVAGVKCRFHVGETIHTENSYKYSAPEFQSLSRGAGYVPLQVWCDDADMFSVHVLLVPPRWT